jgi:hypothetical protein
MGFIPQYIEAWGWPKHGRIEVARISEGNRNSYAATPRELPGGRQQIKDQLKQLA